MVSQLDVYRGQALTVPDWGNVFGWGLMLIGLAAVAAAARQVIAGFTTESREELELQARTIPYDKRIELENKYGHWAVETAIGVCPHDDVRCIEREARRLYEARALRR
jgi:hypothetical protein